MRAQSQTIDQRPEVRVALGVGNLRWFHRLCQWLGAFSNGPREIAQVSVYGTWNAKRERFQPIQAEAAVDVAATQSGMAWLTQIYNASI
jgi:hypothetical protein